ncbi:hypothetical protein [Evansella tamaricis]|uniref:Uncharacterized protein n=1 Tax=Evansella tamaricis TaxID=2069301 RepID=A0ABS6JL18_9BACI|nr:hypothetical protein [Evansella tamaricis]MBU9714374.1 hypothetical protein [Evansella tamaricis]
MMELRIIFFGILLTCGLIFLLHKLNYKKADRYKQLWAPILAILISITILRFDLLNVLPIMDTVFAYLPSLQFYSALVFNVLVIVAFFIVKLIFKIGDLGLRWIGGLFQRKVPVLTRFINWIISKFIRLIPKYWRYRLVSNGNKDRTVALFYRKDHRGITLKPDWYFLSLLFRYGSLIAVILFLSYIIVLPFELRGLLAFLLPTYPAVSLIIFLEIMWFLGGLTPTYRPGKISGEDSSSRILSNHAPLYEAYQKLWPERIIANGEQSLSPVHTMETQNGDYNFFKNTSSETEQQLQIILQRLRNQGVTLRETYISITREMLEGKDILVEDPLYGEVKPYLVPAIISRLVNHHRVVLVLKNQQAQKEAKKWLEEGFHGANGLKHLWSIETLERSLEDNISPHILLMDVHQIQEKGTVPFLTEDFNGVPYDTILILEGERILANDIPSLKRFTLQLMDKLPVRPVYWVFSQWYEGLETAVRQAFQIKPEDMLAKRMPSPDIKYMVWKLEGDERFQQRIFPKLHYRTITGEMVLAMVAQKFYIESMQFINQEALPIRESMEDLLDNREHLLDFGLTDTQIRSMKNNVEVYDQYWSVPEKEHAFMFVRDVDYNLVDTLLHWWTNGRQSSFIHIISPPYLLRDYLGKNISFHMGSNRTISPLSSKQPGTPLGIIKPLIDRLMNGYVLERDVIDMLSKNHYDPDIPVREQLQHCFMELLGAEDKVKEALKVRKRRVFDGKAKQFKDEISYNITEKLASLFPMEEKRILKVRKQSGEIIDYLFEGHVSQRYLPGQEHVFHGELYRIDKIHQALGYMEVSYIAQKRAFIYHQERNYELELDNVKNTVKQAPQYMNGSKLQFSLMEVPFHVKTKGYVRFEKYVDLRPDSNYSFVEYEEAKDSHLVNRSFENGKMLKIDIDIENSDENPGNEPDTGKISYTFSFLLNQMFVTLFPHSYPFLAFTSALPEDFFVDTDAGERAPEKILGKMHPSVSVKGSGVEQGKFTFYVLEDSPTQLGLLESIQDNWEGIMNILDDYLKWILEDVQENGSYLRFGNEKLPKIFDLKGTEQFVAKMVSGHTVHKSRLAHQGSIGSEVLREVEEDAEKRSCSFCDKEYIAGHYEVLDDERNRCPECRESAVNHVSELIPIYEHCRAYLIEQFGVELRRDIDLSLVNAETLHSSSGLSFVPENPGRMVGKASMDENLDISVMVENGAPKLQTYMTLVHELTHVWQFDQLNVRFMTLEELEGFATWVELHLAEYFGEKVYAEKFVENLRKRNDVYSKGYFQLLETLKNTPNVTNPFELFGGESSSN